MTPARPDRLSLWCGWVLTGGLALTPVLAWAAPLGFAPLLALMGLLSLPALRLPRADRPMLVLLVATLAWALVSTRWSPFVPDTLERNTGLKLALMLPLFWSAVCGARRADPRLARRALVVLAWGLALHGAILLVETATEASLYTALRALAGDPVGSFQYARKNVAHGGFVLALLWPLAAAAGWRAGAPAWLAAPMAVGLGVMAHVFLADAPVLAIAVALAAGGALWLSRRRAAAGIGVLYALAAVAAPHVVLLAARPLLAAQLPQSWAERVSYWLHAAQRIAEHPLRGWGLDASRTFAPQIQLHPHNGPLQAWLELGSLGALALAAFWLLAFRRLGRGEGRDLVAAAAGASAAVYLLFGFVNFGLWQEWWLALGAMLAVILSAEARSRA